MLKAEISGREPSADVSFGIGTLLGCGAFQLGKPPKRCVIYTAVYVSSDCFLPPIQ